MRLESASQQDSFYEIMVTSIEYLGLIYIDYLPRQLSVCEPIVDYFGAFSSSKIPWLKSLTPCSKTVNNPIDIIFVFM